MIKQITNRGNLNSAYERVKRNKGAGGVDGMQVQELLTHLVKHGETFVSQIESGEYLVSPILGVEIPKSNGKKRLLGIPTVTDRLFQQALHHVLSPLFEEEFQEHSYGFRPNKSATDAVKQSLQYINEGYQYIVDIDLKSFFDEVDHSILLELIYRKVKCPHTMKLIRSFLRAPIQIDGKLYKRNKGLQQPLSKDELDDYHHQSRKKGKRCGKHKSRRKGVPQGGPLSPLLSNIILNELDKELERRGLRYVRYADDFSIYTKSKKAARRAGNNIYQFLKDKLKLPINRDKSGICRPINFKTLGYGFVPNYKKGEKGKYQLVVDTSRWKTLKQKLKRITRKTTPATFDERITDIGYLMRGWINYFKMASMYQKLKKIDEWLRNRLRYCIWHDWKKPERKRKNLIRLGVEGGMAYAWSRTRMGGWRVAQSPILGTTITVARLQQRGYVSMLDYYKLRTKC